MKRTTAFLSGLMLSAPLVAMECQNTTGVDLCLEQANGDLSREVTGQRQIIDFNNDGLEDLVRISETDKQLEILLGQECSGISDSLCFSLPHLYEVYDAKGFSVDELNGDGLLDLTVRNSENTLEVYLQRGEGGDLGEPKVVGLLGKDGMTPDRYTASSVDYPKEPHGAFDGLIYGAHFRVTETEYDFNHPWFKSDSWSSAKDKTRAQWLQIDFIKPTKLAKFTLYPLGFRPVVNTQYPKNVTWQYSNDGVNFIDVQDFFLESVIPSEYFMNEYTVIDSAPFARYWRFYMHDKHQGSRGFIKIDELLMKGYQLEE